MISVCMATFNGEKFLKEQIESIITQLGSDDELIISDDGSTDDTLQILASYNDSRIKIINHVKNSGFSKIKYSRSFKGDYIFLTDQDDIWMTNKTEKMIAALQSKDCVMCKNSVIDSLGNICTTYEEKPIFSKSVMKNLRTTPFLGCCMAFTKNAVNYILPFPKKCIGHDLWIGCLCAYKNQLAYIDEPLHKYRVHDNNVSPSVTKQSKNPLWFKIYYRISFLLQVYKRLYK